MRTLANIIWHIPFCGFLQALFSFLVGTLLVILVIPSPIGLGLIQYAKFLMFPFSYEMVDRSILPGQQNPLWRAYSFIIMLLYLPFGIFSAICGIIQVVGLAISIIGIPLAIIIAKSLTTYLNPVGKVCIPVRGM